MRHLHEQHFLRVFSLYIAPDPCSAVRLELLFRGGLGVGGAVTTLLEEGLLLLVDLFFLPNEENFDERGGVAGARGGGSG